MPLSAAVLSNLMVTNIQAIPGIVITDPAELARFTLAISTAVVTHITTAGTLVVVVTNVQGGVGTAPGTGTIV